MDFVNFLYISSLVIGIVVGIIVILSHISKVNTFLAKYKYFKKTLSFLKFIFILIGFLFIIFLIWGKVKFVGEYDSDKIYSLTNPSCLKSSMSEGMIDFEWIIQSEEEFDTRLVYFSIPFSSGEYKEVPFFNKNWESVKIIQGRNTIQNEINCSNSQKGRYKICAQVVNKLNNEEILEMNCCPVTL